MSESVKEVLYVVMPAYNEEDNIEQVVVDWIKVLKNGSGKSRLVVADSGSTDDTHRILLDLQKKYKQLEIIEDTNQYHGPKVIALYKYAIKNGADFVFQTDSDGQTDPDEFKGFWAERHRYDGIIGDRRVRGDGKGRAFVEKVVCFLLRVFFGVKVKDANAPFRLMKSEMLEKYLGKLPSEYEIPNIILTAYFVKFKEKILFKEVKFEPRVAGKNSVDMKKIIKIGMRALGDFCRFKRDMDKADGESDNKMSILKRMVVFGVFALTAGFLIIIPSAFPWNGGVEMTDSSVFLTVGRQMNNGDMPYVDTFDHKGPLLYIINYFGVMINETKGIFIFEFLAIFFTLWFMFKIFRLKSNSVWFPTVMTLLLFTPFINLYLIDAGNLTEQYAMPFVAYSLYVFLKYFLDGKVSLAKVFWVGVGFACVLMMRVNMVGVWAVFCIAVLIEGIYRKKYKELRSYLLTFLVGTVSVILPIIIWLAVNGALGSFVDIYIGFNLSYSGEPISGIIPTILYFVGDVIIALSFCLTVGLALFRKKDRDKFLLATYLVVFVLCIVAACMSGRIYPHYGMVLAPFTVFPFSFICCDLSGKSNNQEAIYGVIALFLVSLTLNTWLEVIRRGDDTLSHRREANETAQAVDGICAYINNNVDNSRPITVYGNMNYIYLRCNRLPASKYSYQFPIAEVKPSIMDEYLEEIDKNKPEVFVLQNQYSNDTVIQYLESHNYKEKRRDDTVGVTIYLLSGTNDEKNG